MDWLIAIRNKQGMAPDHILIYVNNAEHDAQSPHPEGSGMIKFNTSTALYDVFNTASGTGNQPCRGNLTEEEVPHTLEELGIVDSTWV